MAKKVNPKTIHRLLSDWPELCQFYHIRPLKKCSDSEFKRISGCSKTAFWIAKALQDTYFLKGETLEEFIAAVNVISQEME